jgi:hypothetical protein
MSMVVVACVIVGLSMKGLAFWDVFHTLFHPAGRGAISDFLARGVWTIFRTIAKRRHQAIVLAGPVAILTIISVWATLLVVGDALIFWKFIAKCFVMASGMDIKQHTSFFDALNISLGGLITLSGDFNSNSRILRLMMGMEGVFGFGLLTASVSWLLSVYPVLERRRSMSHEVTLLHKAEELEGIDVRSLPEQELQTLLLGLTQQVSTIRNDLSQFPITYYFHVGERITATPGVMAYMYDLAESCSESKYGKGVRLSASMLAGSITDYTNLVAEVFLRKDEREPRKVIRMYAKDHLRELMPEEPMKWAA